MQYYSFWTYLLLAAPGIIFYVVNWAIFIHNSLGKKWSSNIPPLGGFWISVVCLLSPVKLLALIGLTDAFFVLVVMCFILPPKTEEQPETSEDSDDADGKEE